MNGSTISDFQYEFAEELVILVRQLKACEKSALALKKLTTDAAINYNSGESPALPKSNISILQLRREVMLLADKLTAVNAGVHYGVMAELVADCHSLLDE